MHLADLSVLKEELKNVKDINFSVDMSERDNKPHYQILLSYYSEVKKKPIAKLAFSGPSDPCS